MILRGTMHLPSEEGHSIHAMARILAYQPASLDGTNPKRSSNMFEPCNESKHSMLKGYCNWSLVGQILLSRKGLDLATWCWKVTTADASQANWASKHQPESRTGAVASHRCESRQAENTRRDTWTAASILSQCYHLALDPCWFLVFEHWELKAMEIRVSWRLHDPALMVPRSTQEFNHGHEVAAEKWRTDQSLPKRIAGFAAELFIYLKRRHNKDF